jgi:hypothetical protein
MEDFGIFSAILSILRPNVNYGHLVQFVVFFSVLVCSTEKNLATLKSDTRAGAPRTKRK